MNVAVTRRLKQQIREFLKEDGRAIEGKLLSTVAVDMGIPVDEVERVYDDLLKRGELYKHPASDDDATVVKITENEL